MTKGAYVPTSISNRLDKRFAKCREEGRAALVLFITCGFPNLPFTRELLPVLAESGCDLIELGVPFSDPIADGPVIQHSSNVSLQAGTTTIKVLEEVRAFRKAYDNPVILFGALNPYLARGLEETARMTAEAGADGILAADLPYDEADEFRAALAKENLHLITLVAPTTPEKRLARFAEHSTGFLYCIAVKGVTGGGSGLGIDTAAYLSRVKATARIPVALGFGISEPQHVRAAVDDGADGVVVGSALIRLIERAAAEGGDWKKTVSEYVKSLAAELKKSPR